MKVSLIFTWKHHNRYDKVIFLPFKIVYLLRFEFTTVNNSIKKDNFVLKYIKFLDPIYKKKNMIQYFISKLSTFQYFAFPVTYIEYNKIKLSFFSNIDFFIWLRKILFSHSRQFCITAFTNNFIFHLSYGKVINFLSLVRRLLFICSTKKTFFFMCRSFIL